MRLTIFNKDLYLPIISNISLFLNNTSPTYYNYLYNILLQILDNYNNDLHIIDLTTKLDYYNLNNIIYLNCENTNIDYLPNNLIFLKKLNITNTKVNVIPKTFNNLIELFAAGSLLYKLSKKLINLQSLTINDTKIVKLKYYNNLEYLKCNNNLLTHIGKYPNLKFLICNNTLIQYFHDIIYHTYFNISYNHKVKYNKNIFDNLLHLNCSNTNIQELPIPLDNLKYLDISNTLITKLQYRSLLKLEILISNDNLLQEINKSLINIKMLSIDNNHNITKIPSNLLNLDHLSINNTTHITKLSKKLKNIKYLSCENSNLKAIPIVYFKLYYLNIINTNIIYNKNIHNGLIFYFY
jgi:hypothetical protein